MEAAPQFWQNPLILRDIYVRSPNGRVVPLSAFASFAPPAARCRSPHQGLFPAVTLSFNLQPGVALGDAVEAIDAAATQAGIPAHHSDLLRRHRAGVSGFARQRANPDRGGLGDRVHSAGCSV